jgi:hypothetical protein
MRIWAGQLGSGVNGCCASEAVTSSFSSARLMSPQIWSDFFNPMKTSLISGLLFLSLAGFAAEPSQIPAPIPYAVVDRGADHDVMEQTMFDRSPSGQITSRAFRYQAIATGLNHLQNGQWVPSSDQIEIDGVDGAVAANCLHRLALPGDIGVGFIEITTDDGVHLKARPLGLSFFDGINSVLIAAVTNSVGQLLPSGNEVMYTNIFGSDVPADLLIVNRLDGVESDLIFRAQLPGPEQFPGLGPNVRIQLLTELFDTPAPTAESSGGIKEIPDSTLHFGSMQMVRGKAFVIGGSDDAAVSVSKSWQTIEGRNFVVEETWYSDVRPQLAGLPLAENSQGKPRFVGVRHASSHRMLPVQKAIARKSGPIRIATVTSPRKGFLWDYNLVSSTADMVFKDDATYYVSSTCNLTGTTVMEAGTSIKFSSSSSARLNIGALICSGSQYHPVVLTSKDDNTVGVNISGSTGTPVRNNGATYLYSTVSNAYHHMRFSYAGTAIQSDTAPANVWHCQFLGCGSAIFTSTTQTNVGLHNVLFSLCSTVVSNGLVSAENITADQAMVLSAVSGSNFTNSILTAITNIGAGVGLYSCATNPTGNGIYQSVGGGAYYLVDASTNRDVGTTNISPALVADLGQRTTYPPQLFVTTTISAPTTYNAQAGRDSDTPDRGYHYDALDYMFADVEADADVAFGPGTAVGYYLTPGDHAIFINGHATVSFNGTAMAPVYWARRNTVQETDDTYTGTAGITGRGANYPNLSEAAAVSGTFLRSAMLYGYGMHMRDDSGILIIRASNSEFWGASHGGYDVASYYTNCLFDGVGIWHSTGDSSYPEFIMRNCTVRRWSVDFAHWEDTPYWFSSFRDCVFDAVALNTSDPSSGNPAVVDYDYNGYVNGATRTSPQGTHDVVLTNTFIWQAGSLGGFYQPTNFINRGSRTADLAGLYHFTTQTNQVKETNSIVDLGYHYVAVMNGVPIDSDGDGTPDYLEDANGNSAVDSGETDWQSASDLGLKVIITRPRNNSTIP